MTDPERERIERMAADPNYPTNYEWVSVISRLPDYEAGTVVNVRRIVEALRDEVMIEREHVISLQDEINTLEDAREALRAALSIIQRRNRGAPFTEADDDAIIAARATLARVDK